MIAASSIHIDTLVLPGASPQVAEVVAQDLHARLGEMEAADLARGINWRQPEHGIDLTLDSGPNGAVDTVAMAAAIRAHFVDRERQP